MRATAYAMGLMFASGAVLGLPPAERVRFASLDGAPDAPVALEGLLFRPPGAVPAAGRTAVIALHGCGGLYSNAKGREAELTERHAQRAEALVAAGYVVLFPDSFNPRGRRELCTERTGARTLRAAQRRLDALGALRWLAALPGVDRERIALLGWSHGGSTVLATINADDPAVRAFRTASGAPPFFRAAVAFYPGCTISLRADAAWRPAVPTRILIGAADDWTPAEPCVALARRAAENGWPLATTTYPGAHHGFDAPSGKVRLRADVPNGVNPGKGVHVGPDPAARVDANRRVDAFLAEVLGARPEPARAPLPPG